MVINSNNTDMAAAGELTTAYCNVFGFVAYPSKHAIKFSSQF